MRRRTKMQLALGLVTAVVLLLAAIVIVVVIRQNTGRSGDDSGAASAPEVVEEVDPFADREADAIAKVQAKSVHGTSVGARVQSGEWMQTFEVYRIEDVETEGWTARRFEGTVYEVMYHSRYGDLRFGPRWLVQMDPDGMAPEGSQGVVGTNAFATQIESEDVRANERLLNRSVEVLQALTEHRFDGGVRLGSALLSFFLGRSGDLDARVVGWTVLPVDVNPEGDSVYAAYFQWYEGETAQDALWNVTYAGGQPSFRASDQRAAEIMNAGNSVAAEDIVDILPNSVREQVEDEDDPTTIEAMLEGVEDARMQALLTLLADSRMVEAVGTLLALRKQEHEVEYVRWDIDYEAGSDEQTIVIDYVFTEDGEEQSVGWLVDRESGARTPRGEVAELATLALEVQIPDPPEEATDEDDG